MKIGWLSYDERFVNLIKNLSLSKHEIFYFNKNKDLDSNINNLYKVKSFQDLLDSEVSVIFTYFRNSSEAYIELYQNGILESVNKLNRKVTLIDLSSISVNLIKKISKHNSINFLSAPIISYSNYMNSTNYIMPVSGKKYIFDDVSKVLADLEIEFFYCGGLASAQVINAATAILNASVTLGVFEAINYAIANNLDLETLYNSVNTGAGSSNVLFEFLPKILKNDFNDLNKNLVGTAHLLKNLMKDNQNNDDEFLIAKVVFGILKKLNTNANDLRGEDFARFYNLELNQIIHEKSETEEIDFSYLDQDFISSEYVVDQEYKIFDTLISNEEPIKIELKKEFIPVQDDKVIETIESNVENLSTNGSLVNDFVENIDNVVDNNDFIFPTVNVEPVEFPTINEIKAESVSNVNDSINVPSEVESQPFNFEDDEIIHETKIIETNESSESNSIICKLNNEEILKPNDEVGLINFSFDKEENKKNNEPLNEEVYQTPKSLNESGLKPELKNFFNEKVDAEKGSLAKNDEVIEEINIQQNNNVSNVNPQNEIPVQPSNNNLIENLISKHLEEKNTDFNDLNANELNDQDNMDDFFNTDIASINGFIPKVLIFDLDGTLLNEDKKVSALNIQTLREAYEKGHEIAIATGRSYEQSIDAINDVGVIRYAIMNNGGLIYDRDNNVIIRNTDPLSLDLIKYFFEIVFDGKIPFLFYSDLQVFVYTFKDEEIPLFKNYISDRSVFLSRMTIDELIEYIQVNEIDIFNLCAYTDKLTEDDWIRMFRYYKEELNECNLTSALKDTIDIYSGSISKYVGYLKLQEILQFYDEDVYFFGDSNNDYELMSHVYNGVAMGNANPRLKRIAKYVIGDNNSSAISDFVKSKILS